MDAAHLVALVPSQVWPLWQAVHTLSLTYLVAAHLVAAAPSQVESLGQASHLLSLTIPAAHLVAVVPSQVKPLGQASHLLSLTYLGAVHLKVSPSADGSYGIDGESVAFQTPLSVRNASTRASDRARTGEGDLWRSPMDAGDADDEVVLVAGLDAERVLACFALRVREASTRALRRAREQGTTHGNFAWTRER